MVKRYQGSGEGVKLTSDLPRASAGLFTKYSKSGGEWDEKTFREWFDEYIAAGKVIYASLEAGR